MSNGCATCRYSFETEGNWEPHNTDPTPILRCRRFPPTVQQGAPNISGGIFPVVRDSWGCGEFDHRPPTIVDESTLTPEGQALLDKALDHS